MRNGIFLALLLLSAACQDVARPPASPPADERSPGIGGLIVASFYFDAAEAAVRTLEFTERLLADEAWIGRQAVIRGITADSVRRELSAESTHTERYLEKKASTQGMTGPEYRRVVEGRMRRVRLANGYEKLLPSRPSQAQTGTATAVAGAPACGSHASDRVSVDKSGCGSSGDESTLFEADPSCISGYRAGTGECCDDMIHIHGDLWCVIVN